MNHCSKNVTTLVVADPIVQMPEQPRHADDYLPSGNSVEAERVHTSSLEDYWRF